jgi:uncharacterized protein (TIGR02246 family)
METPTVEKELLDLEKQYWRALKDNDVTAASTLTDFPCIITGAQGIGRVDERTFARMLTAPPYTIDRFELDDGVQVRMLSENVAVLAYKVHEELTVDGKPVTLDAADSSTWIRRDGRWACALHSEAIVGDPFGRDRKRPSEATATPARATSDDERAIRDLVDEWLAASRAGDLPALLRMMADDVVFMTPGHEPFGKDVFAAMFRGMQDVRVDATAEIEEIEVLGEWAWYRTRLAVTTARPNQEGTHREGRTLTILRKVRGAWVIARDANLLAPQ